MSAPERSDVPAALRTNGYSAPFRGSSSPGSKQGDWMLALINEGRGEYRWRGRRLALAAGMVLLCDPRDDGVLLADDDEPYGYRWCRFGGGYARAWAVALRAGFGAPAVVHPRCTAVAERMQRIGHIVRGELPRRLGRAEVLLLEILQLLDSDESPTAHGFDEARFRAYLEERLDRPSDLAAMAADFGMTRSSLCRAARRVCGTTPQRLHEDLKMAWAPRLLEQRDLSIAQVARRLGYDNPLYFSRVFRRHHACAPRQWRGRG